MLGYYCIAKDKPKNKMKKLLFLFLLIVLSSFVSSLSVDDTTLIAFWKMDEASGNLIDSSTATTTYNLTPSGDPTYQQGGMGISNYSIAFTDGTNDLFANSELISAIDKSVGNITVGLFMNASDITDVAVVAWVVSNGGWNGGLIGDYVALGCSWLSACILSSDVATSASHVVSTGKDYCVIMKINTTGVSIYINGTEEDYTVGTMGVSDASKFTIGGTPDELKDYTGNVAYVAIWNQTLTDSEISEFCDSGIGEDVPPIVGVPANPIWLVPPDDTWVNNTNITLNISHPGTDVNFYLWQGDLAYLYNVSKIGKGINFSTNLSDGSYTFKVSVQNITNGLFSSNVTRIWALDTTGPIITIHPNNAFNSSDVSTINQYKDYIFFNISATDETGLFGFLLNVTKDGISYFNYSNITLSDTSILSFNYSDNISTTNWANGVYEINISVSDAHTISSIKDYDINNGINTIRFDTEEGNRIKISSDGSAYSTLYNKKKDRYEFGWNYLFADSTRKFTLESDSKIHYLPNSKYAAHFVVGNAKGGNWIDFEGIGKDYSVKKINDYKYEITFINLKSTNQIISKSLGGVNIVTESYKWYKGDYTTTSPTASTFGNTETFSLNITRNISYAIPNATLDFNGTFYYVSSIVYGDFIIFSKDIVINRPSGVSQVLPFFWNVTIIQPINDNQYSFKISSTVNISESLIDNCSSYNTTILVINGKDEETNNDVNLTLNIVFIPQNGLNNSYELSGKTNYSFCSDSDINYTLDSIMEYGDETYTDRKYYLNDFQIDTLTIANVYLYHLNNSKASEIVFTVFDTTTGDRVSGAFIKILRYYPGENVYRIVEIAKTDETGQSLGKMVLADVFYKFIIEAPAGTVKLDTSVLRILSLTRSLGITFVENYLDTWNKIYGVSYSVTCTKGTQTCRITWSDESNIVQDVTLEVWRMTGLADKMLFSQTTVASSGTISYTVVEDTTGNRYVAKGFIESNTGASTYPTSWASFFYSDNPFFTDEGHRIASLFPLFLLILVIIFALIDFGTIGVTIGALLGLILGSIVKILPLSPFYLISFVLMGIILIYKLSK